MSRLNKLIKNTHSYEEVAPVPGRSYRYLGSELEKGLLICRRIGINGKKNKQLRYKMVQLIWEGVPCLA